MSGRRPGSSPSFPITVVRPPDLRISFRVTRSGQLTLCRRFTGPTTFCSLCKGSRRPPFILIKLDALNPTNTLDLQRPRLLYLPCPLFLP